MNTILANPNTTPEMEKLNVLQQRTRKKILETYINYDHTFANIHKLGLMAGYSWEQNDDNDSFGLDVYDFYNDNTTFL